MYSKSTPPRGSLSSCPLCLREGYLVLTVAPQAPTPPNWEAVTFDRALSTSAVGRLGAEVVDATVKQGRVTVRHDGQLSCSVCLRLPEEAESYRTVQWNAIELPLTTGGSGNDNIWPEAGWAARGKRLFATPAAPKRTATKVWRDS